MEQFFDYILNDNEEVIIKGLKGNIKLADIVIPDQINGHPVTEIANYAFSNMKTLKTISFSKEMKKIGIAAFKNSGIESVTISNNIRLVGVESFSDYKSSKAGHRRIYVDNKEVIISEEDCVLLDKYLQEKSEYFQKVAEIKKRAKT